MSTASSSIGEIMELVHSLEAGPVSAWAVPQLPSMSPSLAADFLAMTGMEWQAYGRLRWKSRVLLMALQLGPDRHQLASDCGYDSADDLERDIKAWTGVGLRKLREAGALDWRMLTAPLTKDCFWPRELPWSPLSPEAHWPQQTISGRVFTMALREFPEFIAQADHVPQRAILSVDYFLAGREIVLQVLVGGEGSLERSHRYQNLVAQLPEGPRISIDCINEPESFRAAQRWLFGYGCPIHDLRIPVRTIIERSPLELRISWPARYLRKRKQSS